MNRKNTIEELINNIHSDIKNANSKEIDSLFESLKETLKKYDNDPILKDIKDIINLRFKTKRKKCELIFEDIIEEISKPNFDKKDELKKDLLEISEIHRDFLENLISLIGNL